MDITSTVKVKYRTTYSDLKDAMYAYERSNRSIMISFLGVVLILCGILLYYLSGLSVLVFATLLLGILTLGGGFIYITSLLVYIRHRVTYGNQYDVEVTIDNIGIHVKFGPLDTTRSWEDYGLAVEDEKTFVFIFEKKSFFAIPKRVLSQEAISQLRVLIQENVPNFRNL